MDNAPSAPLAAACPTIFRRDWQARGLDEQICALDADTLFSEYRYLLEAATRRAERGKHYFFVAHTGITSSMQRSNRREEHIAVALVNLQRCWPRRCGGWFRWIDYQVPLKAARADQGIGKVDLLGVTNQGQLVVSELKVCPEAGGRGDPPITALLEGLRYAAILEANRETIALELDRMFGVELPPLPLIVQLIGTDDWWQSWRDLQAAGQWIEPFAGLVESIETRTGVSFEFAALDELRLAYGLNGSPPHLESVPNLTQVELRNAELDHDSARSSQSPRKGPTYETQLLERFHAWAEQHDADFLDGRMGERRPPVLAPGHVARNVLTPTDIDLANKIRSAVPAHQRHRHFGSYKSSQALSQSVFGALRECGRLDVLTRIRSECGRPAFPEVLDGWSLELEREISVLDEPRPTSIDVWLEGHERRVAIELTRAARGGRPPAQG